MASLASVDAFVRQHSSDHEQAGDGSTRGGIGTRSERPKDAYVHRPRALFVIKSTTVSTLVEAALTTSGRRGQLVAERKEGHAHTLASPSHQGQRLKPIGVLEGMEINRKKGWGSSQGMEEKFGRDPARGRIVVGGEPLREEDWQT